MARFTISKEFAFSAGHHINGLPAGHPCARPHGHNYRVIMTLASDKVNEVGFVRDFGELSIVKEFIDKHFDHQYLNNVMGEMNTTAEMIAVYLAHVFCLEFPELESVTVWETDKCSATYELIKLGDVAAPVQLYDKDMQPLKRTPPDFYLKDSSKFGLNPFDWWTRGEAVANDAEHWAQFRKRWPVAADNVLKSLGEVNADEASLGVKASTSLSQMGQLDIKFVLDKFMTPVEIAKLVKHGFSLHNKPHIIFDDLDAVSQALIEVMPPDQYQTWMKLHERE
jgi:6-pyruvoyltetrahydropterin/6-carboxytetrahydropterin synthase